MAAEDPAADAGSTSLLLQLPKELLTNHVVPHLGPWACWSLKASCRAMRVAVDGQCAGGHMSILLTDEEVLACGKAREGLRRARTAGGRGTEAAVGHAAQRGIGASGTSAAGAGTGATRASTRPDLGPGAGASSSSSGGGTWGWGGGPTAAQACSSVVRRVQAVAPHLTSAHLAIPHTSKAATTWPQLSASVARLLSMLSAPRLTRLAIQLPANVRGEAGVVLKPEVLAAICSAFPALQELHLEAQFAIPQGSQAAWESALSRLPQSLSTLSLDLRPPPKAKSSFARAVNAAALGHLPGLHTLCVHHPVSWQDMEEVGPNRLGTSGSGEGLVTLLQLGRVRNLAVNISEWASDERARQVLAAAGGSMQTLKLTGKPPLSYGCATVSGTCKGGSDNGGGRVAHLSPT